VALSPHVNYTGRPPTFADRGCRVVSATDPPLLLIQFSWPEPLFFIQAAPQLSSRSCVDPVPDPLFLTKSGSSGNRTRDFWICSQELWPLDHGGIITIVKTINFTFHLFMFHQQKWHVSTLYYIMLKITLPGCYKHTKIWVTFRSFIL
jgi:hypothetical protein